MYHAKREGKSRYRFFEKSMATASIERLELETQLRGALDQNELFLVYQPQVTVKTGRICGVEALLRWNSPKLGIVPPAKFIPVAEENGLIDRIGTWQEKVVWTDRFEQMSTEQATALLELRQRK